MPKIPIFITPEEIQAHLDYSNDPNPIHRDPVAARQAALGLLCAGKKTDPSLIGKISTELSDFVIAPGAYPAIRSIGILGRMSNMQDSHYISDILVRFQEPMLVHIGSNLKTELDITMLDEGAHHSTFEMALRGKSLAGKETTYQEIEIAMARPSSPIWIQRAAESPGLPPQALSWQEPAGQGLDLAAQSTHPYLQLMDAGNAASSGVACLLGMIPPALMASISSIQSDSAYQRLLANTHPRVIEEARRRSELLEEYSRAFGRRLENADERVYAYTSQMLRFLSPGIRGAGSLLRPILALYPQGVSKFTGKHTFQNHGLLRRADREQTYYTGKSEAVSLPAYPSSVLEHALRLKTGRAGTP